MSAYRSNDNSGIPLANCKDAPVPTHLGDIHSLYTVINVSNPAGNFLCGDADIISRDGFLGMNSWRHRGIVDFENLQIKVPIE